MHTLNQRAVLDQKDAVPDQRHRDANRDYPGCDMRGRTTNRAVLPANSGHELLRADPADCIFRS